MTNLALLTVFN